MTSGDVFDAVIVGGSWAGLAAAMQLGRARRRVLVIDAGQPRNRFAEHSHGFLGQDGKSPKEILDTFRAQVLAYPTIQLREDVATAARKRADDVFELDVASGDVVHAARLILATGIADDLPAIPGLRERWGRTVLHCPYCHGYEVADRRLGVLAVSEQSIHQATLVRDWSRDVTLFTNGTFSPDPEQRAQLEARGIRIETRAVDALIGDALIGDALIGDAPHLTGVRLADGGVIAIDALFTASRTRIASPLAEQLGCAFDDGIQGPIVRTDERKETTVAGVYCAGDATRAMHNATFAVADGVMAGIAAHQSLVFATAARKLRKQARGSPLSPAL